jgi:deazaflavin-dependent oxidoreductase (nitroreductase family)
MFTDPERLKRILNNPERQVRVVVAGKELRVTAEQISGTERDQVWQRVCTENPRFGKYGTKTDREIPIIRLTPRAI